MNDYENLKFASLFHDIGKFFQRADNMGKIKQSYDDKYNQLDETDYGIAGAHSKWSADFVKSFFDDIIEDLVLYHHNPQKSKNEALCEILNKSIIHASNEHEVSINNEDVLKKPLTSIFSNVSIFDRESDKYYVPLIELDFFNKKGLHPYEKSNLETDDLQSEYSELWEKFFAEYCSLKNKDFETSLAVVKKFTSTMPSIPNESESDISLYNHLKTTTAIANSRYLFSKEKKLTQNNNQKVYKIINGDISGIQNFIYKINSPDEAQNGMNKRLRGRSLYLTLLSEAIANKIIIDLNLDSSNILFCGGGRFTIIAPNIPKTDEVIRDINSNINSLFINNFNAELYLSLVYLNVSGDDLKDFSNVLNKINLLTDDDKKHKFVNQLNTLFKIEDEVNYEICPVCGNPNSDGGICSECVHHEKLGQSVTNAKYLIKYYSEDELPKSDFFIGFLKLGFIFKSSKNEIINLINEYSDTKFTVYKLNDSNFLEFVGDVENENVSFDFKVIGNNIPAIENKPLTFNQLAEVSDGADKLGVLKMDIDNLGLIFSHGFDNVGGANISRISSLSFYTDLFFSGRINQIINKFNIFTDNYNREDIFDLREITDDDEKIDIYKLNDDSFIKEFRNEGIPTIHINYSGGDDLLVVGPYDDIIKFALEFRTRFKKWTGFNKSINISAGVSIVSPKFPIGKAALLADRELEKSKNCGKDKITIFGETLRWDDDGLEKGFESIFGFGRDLENYVENKLISRGHVFSLLKIWEKNFKKNNISNENDWMRDVQKRLSSKYFVPIFMYKLRLINDKKTREDIAKNGIKFMPWIKTPVSWVSLRLR